MDTDLRTDRQTDTRTHTHTHRPNAITRACAARVNKLFILSAPIFACTVSLIFWDVLLIMAHMFVYNHKNNGLFSQPPPPKRIKTNVLKEGDIVAILTETLEEAPWLAQVTKVEGRNLSIIWMEGSYTSLWKVATVRQGSKTLEWRDRVSVKTVVLSGISLTENKKLTTDLVSEIKDTYST